MPYKELSPDEFLIDPIMPTREVHLVAGPSGAGKSTWVFQMLADLRAGAPVLGYPSVSRPFAYAICDRSTRSGRRALQRATNGKIDFPYLCLRDHPEWPTHGMPAVQHLLNMARREQPDTQLLVIDGFGSLCPGGKVNDYDTVATFLRSMGGLCEKDDMTAIGLVHCSKIKENEQFMRPRDNILGSTAWSSFSECVVYLEYENFKDNNDPGRLLRLLPRDAPNQTFRYKFNETGRLEFVEELQGESHIDENKFGACVAIVAQLAAGEHFTREHFDELAEALKIPRRSMDRYLTKLVELGHIERVFKGTYRRVLPS